MKRFLFLGILVGCLCAALGDSVAGPAADVAASAPAAREAVRDGANLERSRNWMEAIDHYEKSLKTWPDSKDLQYGLRRSKIHFAVERRYADRSFEESLMTLSRSETLSLFDDVMRQVQKNYVDPISATSFVAHGTESLYLALANEKFLDRNLRRADPERIKQMRTILREEFWNKPVAHRSGAYDTVVEVCERARQVLDLPASVVVLEYVFGGCNALDDYSSYLTPDRLDDLYGNIEGEFVGLGIEMQADLGNGMRLVNVLPDSPADLGGMLPGEHIVSIDGIDCLTMTADEAARLLRGPSGSRVWLELLGKDGGRRKASFVRRAVHVKSIPVSMILPGGDGIGYIQMVGFQKTSAAELDESLAALSRQGMRALIWDLRGNPGGLLTAAVEVLDRFIEDGLLVSTRGRTADQNWTYSAHRVNTWSLPLVLLIDGDSASASEIVAGAIRDHGRGVLVGRTTYGKWSVQSIFPVQASTGLRLTTAKFYSPAGQTLDKTGVRPDVSVESLAAQRSFYRNPQEVQVDADADLANAVDVLKRQFAGRRSRSGRPST